MEYNRIVAVTGLPGLFEVVSSKTDGAIVRSLEDKSTRFISSRIHNLSHLESIEVYTSRDNVSLTDVFTAMKADGTKLPDTKDNKALKAYFEKVYPELDFERVYVSDMKKMVKWYEVLSANDIDFSVREQAEETAGEEAAEETATAEEDVAVKAPKAKAKAAPKTAAKKSAKAAPAAKAEEPEATEDKPKKPRKKKTEE